VRLELINPFFKALGWDVYNEAGYAEAYKDVVHAAKTDHEKSLIQRQIKETDKQIDQLVYEVYEVYRLTDEEIQVVEEAMRKKGCLQPPGDR